MIILFEERLSDSPFIETVTHGLTASSGSTIRPAESHWHMVFTRYRGETYSFFVAPLTSAGIVSYGEGAEVLWVKFKLGTVMPHLPPRKFLNQETILPEAASTSFWLKGSPWQIPTHENIETFIDRLAREEILVRDPVVDAALQGKIRDTASRTVRHHFLHTTGLTQTQIYQLERAKKAAALLQQGKSILDTVYEAGYFDQPHLTRSLKQWIGYTPAQLALST